MAEVEKEWPKNQKRAHVLFIPFPTHGHLISAVLLSKQLVRQGIRVTLITNKQQIDSVVCDKDLQLDTVELLQLLGLPGSNAVTGPPMAISDLLEKSFKAANMLDQLSGSEGPTCILSDMFLLWAKDIALQLHIPRYTFIPSGAVMTRFLQAAEDFFIQGTLRATPDRSLERFDGEINVPGLPALRYHELLESCRHNPLKFQITSKQIMEGAGILMNTFYELEASPIDILRDRSPIKDQKFYPVGPLLRTSNSRDGGPEDSKEQCICWLDTQPNSSVLYTCFGTVFRLNPTQIQELALGLERSKHRFLWVLPSGADMLPPGFEARVAERGYIVKGWAPQVQVLSHPSTGGFLTHCGWNSCLEAVSTGVSMLAWPNSADQRMNARYLVDELKVASQLHRAADGVVKQEEIEGAIRLFMEEERLAMRGRMEVLKEKAVTALADGGSSICAIQQFVKDIEY